MNTTSHPLRIIFAAAAIATTLTLFSAVVSNSEPQRSVLIAKTQRLEKMAVAPASVAVALNDTAKAGK